MSYREEAYTILNQSRVTGVTEAFNGLVGVKGTDYCWKVERPNALPAHIK